MTMNKSIELFRNTILETFAGLDKPTRIQRAKKVTKGLENLEKKEKRNPRIKPGGEKAAADTLDMIGQPALAAAARGGALTDPHPNKPTAAQRRSKHVQKRGAEGELDVGLATGLEGLENKKQKEKKKKQNQEKQNEDITTAEKKDIERRSGGDVKKKHELLKKRIDRAIAARKDEARGKYASKRYFDNERKGKRSDRKTYRGHIKFQAQRDDAQARGKIAPPSRGYDDEPEINPNR